MPKIRKKTSNRGTTRLREKVKHKAAESRRKAKKASKKDVTWKSRVKKDPGVPNLFPYKDQILQERQESQRQKEADKQARKTAPDDTIAQSSIAALAATAQIKDDELMDSEIVQVAEDEARSIGEDSSSSMRTYAKSLRKVILHSDVMIEVLDARDPMGTRCIQLEKEVTQQGKRLILLLNKVDLVPKENVEAWLTYLRRSWPTLPFKCSTQSQRTNLSSSNRATKEAVDTKGSNSSSIQPLMQLIKNYIRGASSSIQPHDSSSTTKSRASQTIGVIGFPNVGKSSLINTLKRSRACGVAPTPGYTKDVQEVSLEKGLKILDCPGVVLSSASEMNVAERILRNAVKVEQVEDPISAVAVIVKRCRAEHLMMVYTIPAFAVDGQDEDTRTKEFLIQVARSRGRVKKGGVPDLISAARGVLRDWNVGNIPYFSVAPTLPDASSDAVMSDAHQGQIVPSSSSATIPGASIVTSLAPEFDLDALFQQADDILTTHVKTKKELGMTVKMQPSVSNAMSSDLEDIALLGEESADSTVHDSASKKRSREDQTDATADTSPADTIVSLPPPPTQSEKRVAFASDTSDRDLNTTSAHSATSQRKRMGLDSASTPFVGGENKAILRAAKKEKKRKLKEDSKQSTTLPGNGDNVDMSSKMTTSNQEKEQVSSNQGDGDLPNQAYSFADFFSGVANQ